eukprot:jgi/Mesvir1/13306/Mv08596-RA.1
MPTSGDNCIPRLPPRQLKAAIQEEFPALPRENPGSLWPKTSLAALRDGKRLSMEQLRALKAICSDMQHELAWVAVPLHRISATFYGNRCHESLLFARDFELAAPSGTAPDLSNAFHNHGQGNGATSKLGSTPGEELADGHAAIDGMLHGHSQATDCSSNGHLPEEGGVLNGHTTAANGVERPVVPVVATGGVVKGLAMAVVEANEAARVRSVLSEFDEGNLDNYWFHVSRDGSRESHYRAPFMGASLVQFVDSHLPLPLLQRFQQRAASLLLLSGGQVVTGPASRGDRMLLLARPEKNNRLSSGHEG